MSKAKVLFMCTGNSARSQMAEALLRKYAGDRFDVYSAGLEPKGINPYTKKVMQEIGISLEGHYAKHVGEYMGKHNFGYLITVCSEAEEKCPATFPGVSYRLHWYFEDPAAFIGSDEEILQKFREVRDRIDQQIKKWLAENIQTDT
ncbi:MAG TPA: arsenate reductase ArsC [Syntrophales bacterium]|nr:arsenate reductase ArsC [Syntrophales bacterium]